MGDKMSPFLFAPVLLFTSEVLYYYWRIIIGRWKMRLFKPNVAKMLAKKDLQGLVEALGDEDPKVVWEADKALGDLGDPKASDLLMEALKKPNARLGAIRALGYTSDRRCLEQMIATLHDPDPDIRQAAAFALPMLFYPVERLVEPLAEALKDADHNVRWEAATGLAMMKDARGIDYLVELLQDRSGGYKADAIKALGKYGGSKAVTPLMAIICSDELYDKYDAAEALGQIKDPASIDLLRAAIKDPRQSVRMAAANALEAISGEHHFVL